MRTGAFDVSFRNVKIKHMSTQSKRIVTRDDTATEKSLKQSLEVSQSVPVSLPVPESPPSLDRLVESCARICVPVVCCVLAVYSVSTTLPYMGTLINIVALEMTPVAVLFQHTAPSHIACCTALIAVCACASLFASPDSMRQLFMGYPMYVALVLVLALLAFTPVPVVHDTVQIVRLRAVDLLVVVFTYMAVLSALLMRHLLYHQTRVVQVTEFMLLVLFACTCGFLLHRLGTPVAL